jgi:YD repeat-containing protein
MPPGLPLTATDGRGEVTTHKYAANGDLREVVNPAGGRKLFAYDQLGRLVATTEVTAGSLTAATSEVTYDELNRAVVVRGPETRDAVNPGERHRREERTTYDRAGRKVASSVVDVLGADPPRTTTFGVDAVGRVTSETDDETDAAAITEYDSVGNVSATVDRLGRRTELAYTPRNQLASVTRIGVTDGLGGAPRGRADE